MEDLNAKVGCGRERNTVGDFGLGKRNEKGDRFVKWCSENGQIVMNTWFKKHVRHLYTWKSPGDLYRNQRNYITINERFTNAVTDVKTFPGADLGRVCDHALLVAQMNLRLKNVKNAKSKTKRNWDEIKKKKQRKKEIPAES